MAVKAIFLDWDGTLINSFGLNLTAINATLEHFGKKPISEDFYAASYGLSSRELYTILFQEELEAIDRIEDRETFLSEARDYYYATKAELAKSTPLAKIDGADAFMQTLRDLKNDPKNNLYIGLISNKKEEGLLRELKESGWEDIIDIAVGKTSDHEGKPTTGPLLKALKNYPDRRHPVGREMFYVGDTDVDCDFARSHNIKFVGVGSGITRYLDANERVGGLEELAERFKSLAIEPAAGRAR